MTTPLDGFRDFAPLLTIPSREQGMVPFWPLLPSQEYLLSEFERGFADDVHDFTCLKGGRQTAVGGSTLMDGLTLFYLQTHSGIVGSMVSDDDDNRDYRRDVMLQMLDSLPPSHRQAVRRDNMKMLAWRDNPRRGYHGSRLLFASAGKRADSNVGRSKGLTFGYDDEIGFWLQPRVYKALRLSRAESNPLRFFVGISTANGVGTLFHDEWKTAGKAITRRAIFVACWRNQYATCRIERTDKRWRRYGAPALSQQEKDWGREVARRYDVEIVREFWAWYRWKLAEDMSGDEVLMAQEYGILPEECFQSFGDKFVPPGVIKRIQLMAAVAPEPRGYDYEWAPTLPETKVRVADPDAAPLLVWEEPDRTSVYLIAAHPWGASGPHAKQFVCQVWQAWPDRMQQVAEYCADDGEMYQFAWTVLHLAGSYRTWAPAYLIMEIGYAGMHVLTEIDRLERYGYGLPMEDRERLVNLLASVRHYLYKRPDTLAGGLPVRQMKTTPEIRTRMLYGLRNELERGHVEPRSPGLVEQLATLRRGEDGDSDTIAGGGEAEESRAICAAMAVELWLTTAMPELLAVVAPKEPADNAPTHVAEGIVQGFLAGLARGNG